MLSQTPVFVLTNWKPESSELQIHCFQNLPNWSTSTFHDFLYTIYKKLYLICNLNHFSTLAINICEIIQILVYSRNDF